MYMFTLHVIITKSFYDRLVTTTLYASTTQYTAGYDVSWPCVPKIWIRCGDGPIQYNGIVVTLFKWQFILSKVAIYPIQKTTRTFVYISQECVQVISYQHRQCIIHQRWQQCCYWKPRTECVIFEQHQWQER